MSITITEGTVPESLASRQREPNPFDGKFPTDPGKSLVVELPTSTDDERKAASKVVNAAQRAGRDVEVPVTEDNPHGAISVRVLREPIEGGIQVKPGKPKVEGTRFTFWSVPKIKQNRKPKAPTEADVSDAMEASK